MIASGKEVVKVSGQNGQNKNGQGGRNANSTDTDHGSNKASGNNSDKLCCWSCGRNNHVTAKCDSQSWEGIEKDVKQQRAYLNKEKCPYADSERGKACMAKFGVRYIPNVTWVISGLSKKEYYAANKSAAKNKNKCKCSTRANHKCENVFSFTGNSAGKTAPLTALHTITSTSMTNNITLLPNTFPLIVYGQNGKSIVATAMADQGAPHGSYMSHEFAAKVDEIGGRRITCNKQVCGGAGSDRCEYTTTCHSIKAGIIPNASCNILTKEMTISFDTTAIYGDYDIIVGKPVFIQYDLYDILRPLLMQPAPPNHGESIYTFSQPGDNSTGQSLTTDTVAQSFADGVYSTYKPEGWGALTSDAMLDPTASAEVDESPVGRPLRSLTKSAAEGTYYKSSGSDYLRESLSAADLGEETYIRVPMTNETTWPPHPEVVYDLSNPTGNGEVRSWMTIAELSQLEAEHPTLSTQFWGTSRERREQVALCAEFSSLFKTELTREPADIPPLEIKFDTGQVGKTREATDCHRAL